MVRDGSCGRLFAADEHELNELLGSLLVLGPLS